MKVVHSNKENRSTQEWFAKAKEHEANDELREAAAAYEKVIRADRLNEAAYDRLMIICRKMKDATKELAVINKGIKAFQDFYRSSKSASRAVNRLSLSLMKVTGLADKKGQSLYDPEPIAKWKKRKAVVELKLKRK